VKEGSGELGYLTTFMAQLKLTGKLDIRPPALSRRTRQEYALGEEGETVRRPALVHEGQRRPIQFLRLGDWSACAFGADGAIAIREPGRARDYGGVGWIGSDPYEGIEILRIATAIGNADREAGRK
jgi:hypothetical protein